MKALEKWCVFLVILVMAASVTFAQSNWELPDGSSPVILEPAEVPDAMVGPITFAESEFPEGTVIAGLVVNTLDGVPLPAPLSFDFSSLDATINGGPGDIVYVQFPNIEGDSQGTLTIDFGLDVASSSFGFALSCEGGGTVVDGATAQAYDSEGGTVGSPASVDATNEGDGFPEASLTLSPGGAFRSMEVTFDPGNDCGRFAFDNLTYDGLPVPAVPTLPLVVLGLALVIGGALALRRRRHPAV